MRTYLIDNDQNEYIIDLTKTIKHSSEMVEFEFSTIKDNQVVDSEHIFVRKLSGQYFSSIDGKKWSKIARQDSPNRMLNVERVFDLYRGYKPSSLGGAAEGELLTKMPGKVVKILTKVGQSVKKGEPVLILEAMKMENEIKCAIDGVVKTIHVKEGDVLDQGVLMVELESN
jgi:biotin carboxyl carrier protein